LLPILFNLCTKCLTKKALEEFGDIKIGEHVIWTVKYAADLIDYRINYTPGLDQDTN